MWGPLDSQMQLLPARGTALVEGCKTASDQQVLVVPIGPGVEGGDADGVLKALTQL